MTKNTDPTSAPDPASFLPLTPTVFEILLSLVDTHRHGYAIMREVERSSGGSVVLRPGSLYRAVHRLLAQALIEELEEDSAVDERRRTYGLTALGREVARAEAQRYAAVLRSPGARELISDRESP